MSCPQTFRENQFVNKKHVLQFKPEILSHTHIKDKLSISPPSKIINEIIFNCYFSIRNIPNINEALLASNLKLLFQSYNIY